MELLALGSVIVLKRGVKKYMIIARGIQLDYNGEQLFFDYGACEYPEGVSGDQMMYFQKDDIAKVLFEGYDDDDNKLMVEAIAQAVEELKPERADVLKLKGME